MALTDQLVAFWELGEASGQRSDSVGVNHLASTNSVGQAAGVASGNCAQFNVASNRFLSIADTADLSASDIDFTIQAWVYLDSKTAKNAILTRYDGTTAGSEYVLYYDEFDELIWKCYGASNSGTGQRIYSSTLSLSTWYCVHVWHDSVNNLIGLSVNAGAAETTGYALGISDGSSTTRMGSLDGTNWAMDGRIDQAGVWKGRVLTGAERTSLYNGGAGLSYAAMGGGGGGPAFMPALPRLTGAAMKRASNY